MKAPGKILGIIPARGGSKGIPGKNMADCAGRPLLDWTVLAARESRHIHHVVVSTDDERILAHARTMGCDVPFVRPAELATDTAAASGVIAHALGHFGNSFDYFVLLQPTSPLRTAADIDGCVEACLNAGAPAAVTISEARQSPYLMYRQGHTGTLTPLLEASSLRRQDLPKIYAVNGAVYVARSEWYLQSLSFFSPATVGHIMPPDRAVDIDEPIDLLVAQILLRERLGMPAVTT